MLKFVLHIFVKEYDKMVVSKSIAQILYHSSIFHIHCCAQMWEMGAK